MSLRRWVAVHGGWTFLKAEYEALIIGLTLAEGFGVKHLTPKCDSQLIVGQVTSEFQEKDDRMASYFQRAKALSL